MALDPKFVSKLAALAKARNKFILERQADLEEDRKRALRMQYESAQSGNNGMWGMAAMGASLGFMFGGPMGAGIGAGAGLSLGALTEGIQNKKTAQQFGQKGYSNWDAFTDLARPPSMQEAGQGAYTLAMMGAQRMNAQSAAAGSMATKPAVDMAQTGYGVVPGANMPSTFSAPPTNTYAPYNPSMQPLFDANGNPLNPFDPRLNNPAYWYMG